MARLKLFGVTIFVILATFFGAPGKAAAADDCQTLKVEPLQVGLVSMLEQARAAKVEALGFRIYEFPILITNEKSPLCFALYDHGKVEFHPLVRPLEISNGRFSFRNKNNKRSASDEEQLKFLIDGRKFDTFLIYQIQKMLVDEFDNSVDSTRIHFAFMVHEGITF